MKLTEHNNLHHVSIYLKNTLFIFPRRPAGSIQHSLKLLHTGCQIINTFIYDHLLECMAHGAQERLWEAL